MVMPAPLLDFLTGRAREALPFLRYAAARNLPASVANDILRQLGGGLRTQTVGDIYSVLQNRTNPERVARLTGENVTLPIEVHTTSPTELGSNYQYVVRTDITTNNQEDFLTVASDVPLSPGEIRQRGAGLFNSALYRDQGEAPIQFDEVVIVEMNRNPL